MLASLGCGNPTALAELKEGEIVLDLGSGGGIDVLLSAKRVGPTGKAYGLDMTDEMLALAQENKRSPGLKTSSFSKAKSRTSRFLITAWTSSFQTASSISRPIRTGSEGSLPGAEAWRPVCRIRRRNARRDASGDPRRGSLWVGCIAGALEENDYRAKLTAAGFDKCDLEPTRIYRVEDARAFLSGQGIDVDAIAPQVDGKFMSALSGQRNRRAACCGPSCCTSCRKLYENELRSAH